MRRRLLANILLLFMLLDFGVALITNWTTPVIVSKSGRASLNVREDTVTFKTIVTLKASSIYPVTYQMDTLFSRFFVSSNGALSLLLSLDYEDDRSHVIKVLAVDGAYSTGTATITIQVQDVNEPPEFTSSSFSPCILDGSGPGTTLDVVSATDLEREMVTHALIGNTDGMFTIDSQSGVIKVSDGNTIDKNTTSTYDFDVRATDGAFIVTSSVAVAVADECSVAVSISVELITILLPILGLIYSQML